MLTDLQKSYRQNMLRNYHFMCQYNLQLGTYSRVLKK